MQSTGRESEREIIHSGAGGADSAADPPGERKKTVSDIACRKGKNI